MTDIRNLVPLDTGHDDTTLFAEYTPPTITRRVQLTTTVKDGYRVGEVSVTLNGTYDEETLDSDYETIARELESLAKIGQMVSEKLNRNRPTEVVVAIENKAGS